MRHCGITTLHLPAFGAIRNMFSTSILAGVVDLDNLALDIRERTWRLQDAIPCKPDVCQGIYDFQHRTERRQSLHLRIYLLKAATVCDRICVCLACVQRTQFHAKDTHLSGFGNVPGSRCRLQACVETVVPPGMRYPPNLDPPDGTILGRAPGAAPYSLRVSLITAFRMGSSSSFASVIGSSTFVTSASSDFCNLLSDTTAHTR